MRVNITFQYQLSIWRMRSTFYSNKALLTHVFYFYCNLSRRFTHGHLAQLKYILPETVVIKKIPRFDERTNCMKLDLHVTINPDAIESDAKLLSEGGSVFVRKLFWTRLRDFYKSHSEVHKNPNYHIYLMLYYEGLFSDIQFVDELNSII